MAFNLAVAKKIINDYLETIDLNTKNEMKICLETILLTITVVEQNASRKFSDKMTVELDIDGSFEQISKNIVAAHQECKKSCEELTKKINGDLLNLENFLKPEDKDFLKKIIEHVDAVIETSCADNEDEVKNFFMERKILYTYCKVMGGYFLPMTQLYDPLLGKEGESKSEWENSGGKCAGFVIEQAKSIAQTGTSNPFPVTGGIQQHYYEQKGLELVKLWFEMNRSFNKDNITQISGIKTFIEEIMQKVTSIAGSKNVHWISFEDKSSSGGHVMRLRTMPASTVIEYFDPNQGTFYFTNKEAMSSFFTALMGMYKENTSCFSFTCRPLGCNNISPDMPNIIRHPYLPKKETKEVLTLLIDSIEAIGNAVPLSSEANYTDELNNCRMRFYDSALIFIDCIKMIGPLDAFKKYLEAAGESIQFLFDEKEDCKELAIIKKEIESKLDYINNQKNPVQNVKSDLKPKYDISPVSYGNPKDITNKICYFNQTEKSIVDIGNDFKSLIAELIETFETNLETIRLSVMCKTYELELLDMLKIVDAGFLDNNFELIQEFIKKYKKALLEFQSHYSKKDRWNVESKIDVSELIEENIKNAQDKISLFLSQYKEMVVVKESKVFGLDNEQRVKADKQKLQTIYNQLKESRIGGNSGSSGNSKSNAMLSDTVVTAKQLGRLKKIIDKDYITYNELEKDVHKLNATAHLEVKLQGILLRNHLNDFFTDYLGYKKYNPKIKTFSSSMLIDVERNFANKSNTDATDEEMSSENEIPFEANSIVENDKETDVSGKYFYVKASDFKSVLDGNNQPFQVYSEKPRACRDEFVIISAPVGTKFNTKGNIVFPVNYNVKKIPVLHEEKKPNRVIGFFKKDPRLSWNDTKDAFVNLKSMLVRYIEAADEVFSTRTNTDLKCLLEQELRSKNIDNIEDCKAMVAFMQAQASTVPNKEGTYYLTLTFAIWKLAEHIVALQLTNEIREQLATIKNKPSIH